MNNKILSVDYNKIFGVDIETVRQEENFDENSPMYDLWAWKCRDKDTNEIPPTEEVIKRYNNQAALYPEYGKIVCISIGYISDNTIITKSLTGDEQDILEEFVKIIEGSGRKLVVHNREFDIPYIQKRFVIKCKGQIFPSKYNLFSIKPWESEDSVLCTMNTWKNIGWQNTSLAELAYCMGVPTPKDDINGSEVNRVYWEEKDINRIAKYCEKDVLTVLNILRVWKGDSILEQVSRTGEEVKIENVPVLNRIYQSSEITEHDLKELKEILKTKKINKKEKDILKDMIYKVSLNSDMFAYETKAVKEEKKQVIENLINGL